MATEKELPVWNLESVLPVHSRCLREGEKIHTDQVEKYKIDRLEGSGNVIFNQ